MGYGQWTRYSSFVILKNHEKLNKYKKFWVRFLELNTNLFHAVHYNTVGPLTTDIFCFKIRLYFYDFKMAEKTRF